MRELSPPAQGFPKAPMSKSTFKLKRTNSYDLREHTSRIKHGNAFCVQPLQLIFDTYEKAKSFHCDYQLYVANLTEPIVGQLNFIVDRN